MRDDFRAWARAPAGRPLKGVSWCGFARTKPSHQPFQPIAVSTGRLSTGGHRLTRTYRPGTPPWRSRLPTTPAPSSTGNSQVGIPTPPPPLPESVESPVPLVGLTLTPALSSVTANERLEDGPSGARPPPAVTLGFVNSTEKSSSPSTRLSSTRGTSNVRLVVPATKLSVPEAGV